VNLRHRRDRAASGACSTAAEISSISINWLGSAMAMSSVVSPALERNEVIAEHQVDGDRP